jgi:hypothetical protein
MRVGMSFGLAFFGEVAVLCRILDISEREKVQKVI